MTLDEIEKLASETLARVEEFREGQPHATEIIEWLDARHDTQIARAVMAMMPVVKAACRLEDTRRAVIGGKDTHRELLGRGEDFESAVDAMRGALEGKP